MTKPLHVGHAARNGMLAALLAADGITSSANAFEDKQVFNGAGNYNAAAMLMLGRGPENPLPTELLEAKFANCAARTMSANPVPALLQQRRSLETVDSLASLSDLLREASR